MRWQPMQLELEVETHHRALRRCHGCGIFVRQAEEGKGVLRCERCVEKARRDEERDDLQEDLSIVR